VVSSEELTVRIERIDPNFKDHSFSLYIHIGIVDFLCIMTQTTVESLFGTKAGVVWRALNQNGPSNITNLVKTTSMSREEIFSALGWLGREDKIAIEQRGREMIFSLRETEMPLEAPPKTTMEDYAPKATAKAKRSKSKPPKKAKKAQAVKAPVKQDESQAKESERTKDFLLH
jgi:hypothetical protein